MNRTVLFILCAAAVVAGGAWLLTRSSSAAARMHSPADHDDALGQEMKVGGTWLQRGAGRSVEVREGTAELGGRTDSGLSKYPDYPLKSKLQMPVSPEYLITHRTALKGKVVRVRGIITAAPGAGAAPSPTANPQPRIFLANSASDERDRNYDLTVLLREGDAAYRVRETVEVTGVVESSKTAVYLRKRY